MKWQKRGTTYTSENAIITRLAWDSWQLRIAYPDGRIEYEFKSTMEAAQRCAARLLREERMRRG